MGTCFVRTALFALAAVLLAAVLLLWPGPSVWTPVKQVLLGRRTVAAVLERYGPAAESRLLPHFEAASVSYPPSGITLVALKAERRLELWAEGSDGPVYITAYPILGASGGPGPKLRQGDLQVPEGVYGIPALNPNSSFHLSLRVDYPSPADREAARSDGRSQLGGDIFIHGKRGSVGCLAMGDQAIEELFVLAARTEAENRHLISVPWDLRTAEGRKRPRPAGPPWLATRYDALQRALADYPTPRKRPSRLDGAPAFR